MGSLSNDVLSVQRTKGSAFAIIIDEVMTQTFGQLGSGSAGRDARDMAPPRRRSRTGSLNDLLSQNGAGLLFVEALSTLSTAIRAHCTCIGTSGTT